MSDLIEYLERIELEEEEWEQNRSFLNGFIMLGMPLIVPREMTPLWMQSLMNP